ncbi:606_t:CDS:2 [Ambispora gerdemannii]|uniref:606_t:CDS:1 n=1 Tax=Ambispora gerdemannii TaxID=144530 RepID=A0A9N9CDK0_9GLOM|nr:606_t:CDS:2 [Ambispora gerdemannii]
MLVSPVCLPPVSVGNPNFVTSKVTTTLLSKPTTPTNTPIISIMVSESPQASSPSQFSSKPLKVLIVDDNDINLKILTKILAKHFGHLIQATSTLSSGVSALDSLAKDEYDLILIDIEMPVLSGVETTIEIRRVDSKYKILESNRKIPIIAVTTNTLEDERKKYTEAGMNGCVAKPIDLDELKTVIEKAIGEGIEIKKPELLVATTS